MKTLAAARAKLAFGELIDDAQTEPIAITRHERPVAVVISAREYERLSAIEDANWVRLAEAAIAKGEFADDAKSRVALRDILHG